MTSGNLSDEPIAHDDDDAVARLGPLVDGLLGHDRPIHIRCDDSVVRAVRGRGLQLLRRSRGLRAASRWPCRSMPRPRRAGRRRRAEEHGRGRPRATRSSPATTSATSSTSPPTGRSCRPSTTSARSTACVPEVVAHDLHPEYLSTKFAARPRPPVRRRAAPPRPRRVVHGRARPRRTRCSALAFDGLGYGTDGTLWGGELLVADLRRLRAGRPPRARSPCPAASPRSGSRGAWASRGLHRGRCGSTCRSTTRAATPCSTSLPRGHGPVTTQHGPAVRRGRRAARSAAARHLRGPGGDRAGGAGPSVPRAEAPTFPVEIVRGAAHQARSCSTRRRSSPRSSRTGRRERRRRCSPPAFHEALGRAAASAGARPGPRDGLDTVALTGGVFQNPRLTDVVEEALTAAGLEVLVHRIVPPNDGGISIGQAAVAAAIV